MIFRKDFVFVRTVSRKFSKIDLETLSKLYSSYVPIFLMGKTSLTRTTLVNRTKLKTCLESKHQKCPFRANNLPVLERATVKVTSYDTAYNITFKLDVDVLNKVIETLKVMMKRIIPVDRNFAEVTLVFFNNSILIIKIHST